MIYNCNEGYAGTGLSGASPGTVPMRAGLGVAGGRGSCGCAAGGFRESRGSRGSRGTRGAPGLTQGQSLWYGLRCGGLPRAQTWRPRLCGALGESVLHARRAGRAVQTLWLDPRANIQTFTNAGCALHFSARAKISLTG